MKILVSISAVELTSKDIKKALAARTKADLLQAKIDGIEKEVGILRKASVLDKAAGHNVKIKALRAKNKELKTKHKDLLKSIPASLRTRSAKQLTKQLETAEKKESKNKEKGQSSIKAVALKQLYTVPKLSDLWKSSPEFSPEVNERARQAAIKEINAIKEKNLKIKEENKKNAAGRRTAKEQFKSTVDVNKFGKAVGSLAKNLINNYLTKYKLTKDKFKEKLLKSPNYRKNFLILLVTAPIGKDNKKTLNNLSKYGSNEDLKAFYENLLK